MGFFARLFGGSKSTSSATVSADNGPKPESEVVQAQETLVQETLVQQQPAEEQPVSSAPVQSIAQEAEEAKPAVEAEAPEQPVAPETAPSTAPEASAPQPEDEEEPAPESSAPAPEPVLASDEVVYVLTTFGVDSIDPAFMATKKVYRAGSRQAAVAFLRTQVVTETLTYIEVETPDGPFGIDLRHRVFNAHGHFVDF